MAADIAEAGPEPGVGAAVGALGVAAGPVVARGRHGAEDVARASTTDMSDGRGLLADFGALELLVEAQSLTLGGGVNISSTSTAGIEAGGVGGGRYGRSPDRDTGGGGRLRGTEIVAGAATAAVGVAVLGHGGVRLGECVGRRHLVFGWCGL